MGASIQDSGEGPHRLAHNIGGNWGSKSLSDFGIEVIKKKLQITSTKVGVFLMTKIHIFRSTKKAGAFMSIITYMTLLLLRKSMNILRSKMKLEINDEQSGFEEGKCTNNPIYILRTLFEWATE